MKLETILEMDEEPFDTDVFDKVYYPKYTNAPGLPDAYAMLIFQYYRKFDEKYGTTLMRYVKTKRVLPTEEVEMLWHDNSLSIFAEAAEVSGWSVDLINLHECELSGMLENGGYQSHLDNEREIFDEIFSEFLSIEFNSDFFRSCYTSIVDTVYDAINCMDDAVMCVMSNEKLDKYMMYREEHQSVIAAVCSKEDQYISELQDNIQYPFSVFYDNEVRECEEEKYRGRRFIVTLLGYDGYNCCSESCVNPNWICATVKLGMLLDLALEKIDICENLQKSRAS